MPPTKIMLIRHGEKETTPPPAGVDEDGSADKHALTVRGWQRAGALVPFFRGQIANAAIAQPTLIFAAATSDTANVTVDGENVAKSRRPQQTVAPLARALGLSVNASFAVGDERNVAQAIAAADGVVLVAWEHKHLPAIAHEFATSAPASWPAASVFDVVWVLDRANGTYTFRSVNQFLLDGDTD